MMSADRTATRADVDHAPVGADVEGVVVIDKEVGMTSHDVVAAIRRIVGSKPGRRGRRKGPKVGHAGTLDPDATGVLVVCIGRATRLVPYLQASQKTYDARMRLGRTTTTLDNEGEETSRTDASAVTEAELCEVLKSFVGDIEQIPPMVSAVRVDGERLHVKARRGEEVEREPRPVTIHDIVLADFAPGPEATASFLVTCSAGTYVRTLAADVGEALEVGAHLTGLRRLGSGRFSVEEGRSLEVLQALADEERFAEAVMSPAEAMADYPSRLVSDEDAALVRNGRRLPSSGTPGTVSVLTRGGELIAVMTDDGRQAKPDVVFN
ncbi:tRNA pseudouridine(55) synthase TruB [Euzebya tangerina]|uniref:tRNA pseudouridine(55) synthase TruB n=1 Tax=Euzebya tangerina TaxID=591198 RepID=UPI00196A2EB4|nr:tRNA pseudouridine(55) synthase TruB [Euzebya tangerina]